MAPSAQATQAALVSLMETSLNNAWALIDISNLSGTLDRYNAAVAAIVQQFGRSSATLAARYYAAERTAAGIKGTFTVHPLKPPGIEEVTKSLEWATKGLWSTTPNTEAAKSLAQGVAENKVLDTGRYTIIDATNGDRKAKGWARVPEPTACSFCALLATRGAVYKSEESASFRSHNNCRCHVEPIFTSYEPSAQIRQWQQLYRDAKRNHKGTSTLLAFRHAVESSNS